MMREKETEQEYERWAIEEAHRRYVTVVEIDNENGGRRSVAPGIAQGKVWMGDFMGTQKASPLADYGMEEEEKKAFFGGPSGRYPASRGS